MVYCVLFMVSILFNCFSLFLPGVSVVSDIPQFIFWLLMVLNQKKVVCQLLSIPAVTPPEPQLVQP